eukprot:7061422-Pyramimonas_sp.AAC.1
MKGGAVSTTNCHNVVASLASRRHQQHAIGRGPIGGGKRGYTQGGDQSEEAPRFVLLPYRQGSGGYNRRGVQGVSAVGNHKSGVSIADARRYRSKLSTKRTPRGGHGGDINTHIKTHVKPHTTRALNVLRMRAAAISDDHAEDAPLSTVVVAPTRLVTAPWAQSVEEIASRYFPEDTSLTRGLTPEQVRVLPGSNSISPLPPIIFSFKKTNCFTLFLSSTD